MVFILNTLSGDDTSNHLGHWIAIYLNYQTLTIGYFDSYNLSPLANSLALHVFIQTHTFEFNIKPRTKLQFGHYLPCRHHRRN